MVSLKHVQRLCILSAIWFWFNFEHIIMCCIWWLRPLSTSEILMIFFCILYALWMIQVQINLRVLCRCNQVFYLPWKFNTFLWGNASNTTKTNLFSCSSARKPDDGPCFLPGNLLICYNFKSFSPFDFIIFTGWIDDLWKFFFEHSEISI